MTVTLQCSKWQRSCAGVQVPTLRTELPQRVLTATQLVSWALSTFTAGRGSVERLDLVGMVGLGDHVAAETTCAEGGVTAFAAHCSRHTETYFAIHYLPRLSSKGLVPSQGHIRWFEAIWK